MSLLSEQRDTGAVFVAAHRRLGIERRGYKTRSLCTSTVGHQNRVVGRNEKSHRKLQGDRALKLNSRLCFYCHYCASNSFSRLRFRTQHVIAATKPMKHRIEPIQIDVRIT